MRRALAGLVVLGALAAGFVLSGATDQDGETKSYKIVFDNAFGLVEGGDFRVGGVRAGQTTEFEALKEKGQIPRAVVTAEISEPGFDDFRTDASCEIKPQSTIGEYYVDCQTGSSAKKLKNGGTVPVEQTASTIPQDLVNNILRRPYRERFRLILTELGTGLAGRPQDLQAVLRRAHPGLRETSRVLRILGDQNEIIENFIADSDRVVEELERNKQDVARWIVEAGETAEISATRRAELAATFRKLPGFLDELRPTMRRLGELADEQTPLLIDLRRAAPDLETFFTRLGPFSEASRPAIRSLGRTSAVGTRAFRKGAEEVQELRRLAPEAQPTFKPLRQFLETSDDRSRALENDGRAKIGSPPAPDKTAIPGEGGFTGLEGLWNYFFWQTLSINGYDEVGHLLRIGITDTKCSDLYNDFDLSRPDDPDENPADRETFEDCKQWLGPNQPGLTTPDFTDSPQTLARLQRESNRPASRVGERRAPGQPEAAPLPGQRDISKPQLALPPQVKDLLDRLDPSQLPSLPQLQQQLESRAGAGDAQQLLDFLLTP